jgi:putative flavoprotein involved in K+ transport
MFAMRGRGDAVMEKTERIDTVVIGAGQSGLSVGYHLAGTGVRFVILEANDTIGDTWRRRWDSLRLFTPARFDGLVGKPFPAPPNSFPTKDAMADYLESYAREFKLPVRTGTPVTRVSRHDDGFLVATKDSTIEAKQVVVAMSTFQRPTTPDFARQMDHRVVQLHSLEYRNPAQLAPGGVLVVGAGNSGAEIAMEAARGGHAVWLSGRDVGEAPFSLDTFWARHLLAPFLFRVVFHRLLTIDTPIGRRARPTFTTMGHRLIRVKSRDLTGAGVERVARLRGVKDGLPQTVDGRVLDVANVVWCTGFNPGFSWIQLPVFDASGAPTQRRGVVDSVPGLYFIGLNFLYAVSSTMIHGAARDAEFVAKAIVKRAVERAA